LCGLFIANIAATFWQLFGFIFRPGPRPLAFHALKDAFAQFDELLKALFFSHRPRILTFAVASLTSAIDIAAALDGVRYIPAHDILAIKQTSLAIPIGNRKLIPDQLFALDYGGRYRAFILEVDRGTEPKTSSAARKSYASSIELYRLMIERDLHRAHYGLKATTLVLWVFSRRSNEQRFLEMVGNTGGPAKNLICTQVMPSDRAAQATIGSYYGSDWARCQSGPVLLSRSGLTTG
jgi:hypothetical protein